MQLFRIFFAVAALAVIVTEARFSLPSFFSSLLPFTFNVTSDDTGLGTITLNIKPRFGREVHEYKVKREAAQNGEADELREDRAIFPMANWQLGVPSGASLTLGAVGSLAGLVWTLIAKNLEYKKEHGELEDWKDGEKPFLHGLKSKPIHPSGPVYSPSYSPNYNMPPKFKIKKGFVKGIQEAHSQAMKGFGRLVGLKNLNELLHPGEGKWPKKHPVPQYYPPAYSYPQEYAPAPAYAPPAYAPAPAYAPVYYQPPSAPAYAPPPPPQTSAPAPPPPPPTSAPAPPPTPAYAPPPPYVPAPAPAAPPAMNYPPLYPKPMYARGLQSSPTFNDQTNQASPPASSADGSNTVNPPTFSAPSLIQADDFLPIIPSQVDPLPFMPSQTFDAPDSSSSAGNVPFGIPPPSRGIRYDDSTPLDPNQEMVSVSQNTPPQDVTTIAIAQAETQETTQAVIQETTQTVPQYDVTTTKPPLPIASDNNFITTELPYGARIKKPATVSVTK